MGIILNDHQLCSCNINIKLICFRSTKKKMAKRKQYNKNTSISNVLVMMKKLKRKSQKKKKKQKERKKHKERKKQKERKKRNFLKTKMTIIRIIKIEALYGHTLKESQIIMVQNGRGVNIAGKK